MAARKNQTGKIDPIVVIALAIKNVKTKADYDRIAAVNTPDDLEAAWATLPAEEQTRIYSIYGVGSQPDLKAIADELSACGTLIELKSVKATHGPDVVKAAWQLIPAQERMRLKGICQTEQQSQPEEMPQQVTEQVAVQVEPQPKSRTLFTIGDDLQKLNELLDEAGDDAQQQELIAQWFEQLGDERDRKLDNYAALITEMLSRAAARKVEAQRLMELAQSDENRARLLKDRLKCFFEVHNLKTVETPRYRLSLAKNGGKAPLILDDSLPVTQLPERFQKVSIDPNTAAIRSALEAGEVLGFAQLGERGTSIRIK